MDILNAFSTGEFPRMPSIWMCLVATSTTFIVYRLISNASIAIQLLSTIYYFLNYNIVRAVQSFTWAWTGVQDHCICAENGGAYESSVQVMTIIMRGRISSMDYPRHIDFLGLHESFTHPCALLNPVITLYCVSKSHAYFVECPEEIDIHSSRVSPFMYMAQFEHAVKLYSIPLVHFHRLGEEIGDPKVPVLWISSSGRCGSTLLIQMLENLPGTRCMSEPDVTTNVCLMSRASQLTEEEISQLVQNTIRLLCKESPSVQRIVIKTRFNCSTELTLIQQHFPQFKHLYMYRNLGHVFKSYYKFLHRDLAICILELFYNNKIIRTAATVTWLKRKFLFHLIAGEASQSKLNGVFNDINFMGFVAACVGSCIVEFQYLLDDANLKVPTLHYDELMRSPLEVTTKLFEILELPPQYVQLSLSAMQHDTQKGTILSNISNSYNKRMTGLDIKDTNTVLSLLGLPDMNQNMLLPHSIQS